MVGKQTSSSSSTAITITVGKIDPDPSAIEVLLVEAIDGGVSLLTATEGDETEAARATGIAVAHHDGLTGRR